MVSSEDRPPGPAWMLLPELGSRGENPSTVHGGRLTSFITLLAGHFLLDQHESPWNKPSEPRANMCMVIGLTPA